MGTTGERRQSVYERAVKFAFIGLAGGVVAGIGFALPIALTGGTALGGGGIIGGLLIGFPLGGFVGGLLMGLLSEGLAGLVEGGFQSGHGHSPAGYSQAQSLVARGAYREGVQAYAAAARDNPRDPEPLILGARVLRDHLHQYATAVEWLDRARRLPGLSAHHDITIARDLVDLYDGPQGCPQKAMPELARIASAYPNTNAADWARNELSRLRASVWSDLKGEGAGGESG